MGLKLRNGEWVYVDRFVCFKDDVSSGPSANDTSFTNPLGTLVQGPQGDPGPGTSISQGYANQGSSTAVPNPFFSSSTPFAAGSTAASGVGMSDSGAGATFTSLANPGANVPTGTTGVFESGAAPFQTFGQVGQATGQGLNVGGATSAPGAPGGVTPPGGVDPTQGGGVPFQSAPPTNNNAPAPPAAQGGSFLDNLFSSVSKSVSSNPLSFLGAAGMAYNAYNANQAMKDIPSLSQIAPQLRQQAASLNAQGQQLASYLTSGSLPPGLQASLDQATKSAKATIISNFASRGMSTDPTKNSALASELAAVDAQAVVSTAQIGQNLMQTGINETQLSSGLYTTLANIDNAAQQRIQQSIANFAAALAPSKGVTLNLGKG